MSNPDDPQSVEVEGPHHHPDPPQEPLLKNCPYVQRVTVSSERRRPGDPLTDRVGFRTTFRRDEKQRPLGTKQVSTLGFSGSRDGVRP